MKKFRLTRLHKNIIQTVFSLTKGSCTKKYKLEMSCDGVSANSNSSLRETSLLLSGFSLGLSTTEISFFWLFMLRRFAPQKLPFGAFLLVVVCVHGWFCNKARLSRMVVGSDLLANEKEALVRFVQTSIEGSEGKFGALLLIQLFSFSSNSSYLFCCGYSHRIVA